MFRGLLRFRLAPPSTPNPEVHFIIEALPLERVLRSYFVKSAFLTRNSEFADEADCTEQPQGTHIHRVDEAVHSAWFWAYAKMLLFLQGCLDAIGTWAEQCDCHLVEAYGLTGLSYVARRNTMRAQLLLADPCCRRSMRAPQLAAGFAMEQLQLVANRYFKDLMDNTKERDKTMHICHIECKWSNQTLRKGRTHLPNTWFRKVTLHLAVVLMYLSFFFRPQTQSKKRIREARPHLKFRVLW